MNIQIIGVNPERVKEGQKDFVRLTVTYKNLDNQGKTEVKNLVDFATDKAVYNRLADSKAGDQFSVTSEKKNNFWVWTEVARLDGAVPAKEEAPRFDKPVPTYPSPKREYVDDKVKQRLIVRQSSLSSAVNYGSASGLTADEILEVAEKFTSFVFEEGIAHLKDDRPE